MWYELTILIAVLSSTANGRQIWESMSRSGLTFVSVEQVAREVALGMKPRKIIMINSKGGWVDGDKDPEPGRKLKRISMAEHYEEMASRDYEGRQVRA